MLAVCYDVDGAVVPCADKAPKQSLLSRIATEALRGGLPAMGAVAIQVTTLMWLRTTVNYQYKNGGTSMSDALKALYAQGGVRRFYSGYPVAIFQAPMSRFGDTAANAAWLELVNEYEFSRNLPEVVKTSGSSVLAGGFRIFLMPVDTLKTSLQVDGPQGLSNLKDRIKAQGPIALYRGALASSAATVAGHFPWFTVYNTLQKRIPDYEERKWKLLRSAFIGFQCSLVSDTVSNSVRVVKTVKQTSQTAMTYQEVVQSVIKTDGLIGLFGRGLSTKLVSNGIQGMMFSVLWRMGQDAMAAKKN